MKSHLIFTASVKNQSIVTHVHHAEDEHADEEPVRELEQAVVLPADPVDGGHPHRDRAQGGHPTGGGVDACQGQSSAYESLQKRYVHRTVKKKRKKDQYKNSHVAV